MSLQGPARRRCVRSLNVGSPLRRPCILFFLAMTSSSPVFAHCHIYRVWHYNKPQRCFTALAPFHVKRDLSVAKPASRVPETSQERIDIMIPPIDFVPCPEGDERFQGIAKLHAIMDAPLP
jgi:hypothetical protein